MKVNLNTDDCYGCEFLDGDDWRCTAGEGQCPKEQLVTDLISRQAAIESVSNLASSMSVCSNIDECHGMKRMQGNAVRTLVSLPSAEPERKHGRWIDLDSDGFKCDDIRCSECGITYTVDSPDIFCDIGFTKEDLRFCPNCGADMRGEQE